MPASLRSERFLSGASQEANDFCPDTVYTFTPFMSVTFIPPSPAIAAGPFYSSSSFSFLSVRSFLRLFCPFASSSEQIRNYHLSDRETRLPRKSTSYICSKSWPLMKLATRATHHHDRRQKPSKRFRALLPFHLLLFQETY
jgi:hypothetical protein